MLRYSRRRLVCDLQLFEHHLRALSLKAEMAGAGKIKQGKSKPFMGLAYLPTFGMLSGVNVGACML